MTTGMSKNCHITPADCLMSGLAIFSLKYSSLLQFEKDKKKHDQVLKLNIGNLYGIGNVPCDTYLRERLDDQNFLPIIRAAFASLFFILQRSKALEQWRFFEDKYLISLDASGFFSSNEVKCDHCCQKIFNKASDQETIIYHHQMLVGALVSPDLKSVIPMEFEPIIKEDGDKKNDCERNGAKRWVESFKRYHSQLRAIIVADGLYSNAPFIKLLSEKNCSYILNAKPDDHKSLYEYFWAGEGEDIGELASDVRNKLGEIEKHQKYRFMNEVPLNDTNHDLNVNVLYFEEHNIKTNKKTTWLWITDINITKDNAKLIMKGGRARWRIENETFNTLKNQGYNFEHNFGHGYNGLSNVFAGLMLLAFYVDQILEALNLEYKVLRIEYGSRSNLFEKIRSKFFDFIITSYESLYEYMIHGPPQYIRI
jgi:hypothetical protein